MSDDDLRADGAPPASVPAARTDLRRVRGDVRRKRILSAAVEVFGEQGYRGTSLREIARRVGISDAGLLHHFGSKTGLLAATIAERDERDRERREESEASGVAFVDTMRDQVARNAHSPGLVALHVVLSAEATDPQHPAHESFRERYRHLRHQDDQAFARLQEDGQLRTDLDPRRVGQLVTAMMDGLQLQWLLDPDQVDMVGLFEDFLHLLEIPAPDSGAGAAEHD
ncbi:TetR/AcrR family transcriptional regulator [Microbacterium sp. T2.11-28]|uniref:TetR/AcrR family transcriptional regulator n=1 Tax=unclassified Microbacterium TaxID=2609290 RepID=UPI0024777311|nr:TetR/AcrR family transcriptional regulator [Microbacterium sp. T2.11-28]CAI9394265.1 Fatty acid metabolism regulator protein [Microbacterium sp. T2.11-28]